MKKIVVISLALTLGFFTVQAMAAESTAFYALSGMAADDQAAPSLLTDEQLAAVEGQGHEGWLSQADLLLSDYEFQVTVFNNLGLAQYLQNFALVLLTDQPGH